MNFFELEPHVVLDAIEDFGVQVTGFCLQLNSYENRVFEVHLENGKKVVAKFYRPGRWTADQIKDEHLFLKELADEGIPVVCPLAEEESGHTILETHGIYYSIFPKQYGQSPQEFLPGQLKKLGRTLARMHNVGSRKPAPYRKSLLVEDMGDPALDELQRWIWPDLRTEYNDFAETVFDRIRRPLREMQHIRIHGDCHRGNLLWNTEDFFLVDFDDFLNGPVVQDFWMLTGGEKGEDELDEILSGYDELRKWDDSEWELVPWLRALRLIHYSAWIGKRWEDPSFQRLFPQYKDYMYWLEELGQLKKIVYEAEAWNRS
jgi:Ser/Thr protein kinase RdoA (MazF antagonist)